MPTDMAAQTVPSGETAKRETKGPVVVVSLDDAPASHFTVVGPILKKYGFGATFYICEYPGFENKTHYMTWEQIKQLSDMGFEIGNHGRTHKHVPRMTPQEMNQELEYIEKQCSLFGIPRPITYAYPGYEFNTMGIGVLKERGYQFARTGGERPYTPASDQPYELPSYTIKGNDDSTFQHIQKVLSEARDGQIVILCLHGVPDLAHDWVSTSPDIFQRMTQYLWDKKFTVIAIRDIPLYSPGNKP